MLVIPAEVNPSLDRLRGNDAEPIVGSHRQPVLWLTVGLRRRRKGPQSEKRWLWLPLHPVRS